MKICYICAIYILSGSICYNLSAQVPQSLNYQAVARNINGNALPNKTLGLRISVHDSIASGNIIYKETFSATTNKLGLFTLNIGTGTPVSGIFAAINWGKSNKFLQVEMDTSGGTNYTDLGTTQLLSVPYALYAAKAGNTLNAGNGIKISQDSIINTAPDQNLSLTGNGGTTVSGTYPNFTIHSDSGIVNFKAGKGITINGDTISGSNNSAYQLPQTDTVGLVLVSRAKGAAWIKPFAVDASQYNIGSANQNIQAAVNFASKSGIDAVIINRKDSNNNPWMLDSAIRLPSNMTIYINNTRIKLSNKSRDNFFRSNNIGYGITSFSIDSNIHILGLGDAQLEGADNPRATGDNGKTLTLGNDSNFTKSYGTDAGASGQLQTGDWRDWGIYFGYVQNFGISNITIKNPHGWGISIEKSNNGSLNNIIFNSIGTINAHTIRNQDGIDIRLGCNSIDIKNISGQSGDDLVAVTASGTSTEAPGVYGVSQVTGDAPRAGRADDIRNIHINNIKGYAYSEGSVVRLLGSDGGLNVYNIFVDGVSDITGSNPPMVSTISLNTGYGTSYGQLHDVTVNNVISEANDVIYIGGSLVNSVITNIVKKSTVNTHSPVYFAPGNQGYSNVSLFSKHIAIGDLSAYNDKAISFNDSVKIIDNNEKQGILSAPYYSKTTAPFTNTGSGLVGIAYLDAPNTQNWTAPIGLMGVEAMTQIAPGSSGTVSNVVGINSNAKFSITGASVTNNFGVLIHNPTNISGSAAKTLTNNYGLYIQNQTGGSSLNYSVYSEGGTNYFGGSTTISTNANPLSIERTGVTNTRYGALNIEGNHSGTIDGSNLGIGISFNMANNLNNSTYANVAAIQGVMLSSSNGAETGELQFYTKKSTSGIGASDVRMTIDNNGKVGIGKLPAYNLDVSGPIDADSVMIGGKTILNSKGTNNTSLGYNANTGTGGWSNSTAIGYAATTTSSNTMAFGNSSVTTWAFGRSTVSNSGYALQVGSSSSNGNGAYLTTGGSWTNASDRNKKENFKELNGKEILNRICELSITQWNYKGENIANTHIGPMAQDFYKEFHTGGDSLAISTIDPAGVALVGIQELMKENEKLKEQNELLQKENASIKQTMNQLSNEVDSIKNMLEKNSSTSITTAISPIVHK